jgi:hypothetical protein
VPLNRAVLKGWLAGIAGDEGVNDVNAPHKIKALGVKVESTKSSSDVDYKSSCLSSGIKGNLCFLHKFQHDCVSVVRCTSKLNTVLVLLFPYYMSPQLLFFRTDSLPRVSGFNSSKRIIQLESSIV